MTKLPWSIQRQVGYVEWRVRSYWSAEARAIGGRLFCQPDRFSVAPRVQELLRQALEEEVSSTRSRHG